MSIGALGTTLGAIGLAIVGVGVASPLLASAGPILLVALASEGRHRRRDRRREVDAAHRLGAIDGLIQSLRSGSSLAQGCRGLAADAGLEVLAAELSQGQRLQAAAGALLESLAAEPNPDLELLGVTLEVLADNGGPALPALERLRSTFQHRIDRRRHVQAQAAQGLNSAALLALAPAGFAFLVAMVDPGVSYLYRHELLGAVCGTGAMMLAGIGWWWMRRMIARSGAGQSRPKRTQVVVPGLATTIDMVSVVVGAGGTIHQVVAALAASGTPEARRVFAEVKAGTDQGLLLREALVEVQSSPDAVGFGPLLEALASAQAIGAPIHELLERVAADVAHRTKMQTATAAGQLSVALVPPLVICFLPAMVLGSVVPLAITAIRGIGI